MMSVEEGAKPFGGVPIVPPDAAFERDDLPGHNQLDAPGAGSVGTGAIGEWRLRNED